MPRKNCQALGGMNDSYFEKYLRKQLERRIDINKPYINKDFAISMQEKMFNCGFVHACVFIFINAYSSASFIHKTIDFATTRESIDTWKLNAKKKK